MNLRELYNISVMHEVIKDPLNLRLIVRVEKLVEHQKFKYNKKISSNK
jgi:hypothetical protein